MENFGNFCNKKVLFEAFLNYVDVGTKSLFLMSYFRPLFNSFSFISTNVAKNCTL